ncbi:thiamine diphosphokinase [Celeribacter sp.]|uniref:thiamine diphosphokinase n=1 Tax=Celeribacter sp. TaxID=1890673 RepID=UPI003A91ADDE
MAIPVIKSASGVTVLGSGNATPALLSRALTQAKPLIAADGSAQIALDWGHMPDAVIGDFDSLDNKARALIPSDRFYHIPEQDSTDFEKCLTRIDAPYVLGVGFMGARVDHELAVLSAMVRFADRQIVLLGTHDICVHLSSPLTLTLPVGCRVSLFPMAPVTGRSTGLKWPIEGIDFAPDGRVGTSNEASDTQVHIEMDGAGMLLFLSPEALDALLAGLGI